MELGDFMVTETGGWLAKAIRWCTRSTVNHAAIYVGNGRIVEADPKGAKLSSAKSHPEAIWSHLPLTQQQRVQLGVKALSLVGTPYNFLDIGAQAFVRVLGWQAPKWALDRLSNPRRLQCAQLVDYCYSSVGYHLFTNRPAGLVAPSDLLAVIEGDVHSRD